MRTTAMPPRGGRFEWLPGVSLAFFSTSSRRRPEEAIERLDASPPLRPHGGPRTGMRGSPRARIGLCCAAHADPGGSRSTEEEIMDKKLTTEFVDKAWDSSIVP